MSAPPGVVAPQGSPTDSYVGLRNRLAAAGARINWILVLAGVALLLAVAQQFATPKTTQLTSSGTWATAVAWSIPIMMAGLGGIFSERSGIVNIGLEGMLVLGTWFGAFGTMVGGPWYGMILAVLAGAVGGLILALATVTFGVDHIIAGVAINVMAPGVARFLSSIHFRDRGGSITQSTTLSSTASFDVPFLAGGKLFGWESPDLLRTIERWDFFFISDFAGILRGGVSNMSWLTLIAILIVPTSAFVLWRTRFGLRLRSSGEHPIGADSLGVNVYRYRYAGVMLSGGLAGYGGGFLAIQLSGLYREGQTLGKGFIGLATTIFGNWRPVGTALGSLLFGFTETLRLRDPNATRGLILLVALVMLLVALRSIYKRNTVAVSAVLFGLTGLIWFWYLTTNSVPNQLPRITPHITVLVVLVFFTRRLRPPAAEGQPYRRGDH